MSGVEKEQIVGDAGNSIAFGPSAWPAWKFGKAARGEGYYADSN